MLHAPIPVCEVDVQRATALVRSGGDIARPSVVWALVRTAGRPVFAGPLVFDAVLSRESLLDAARAVVADSRPTYDVVSRPIHELPEISVVVCTRERPDSLARCLTSLAAMTYAAPFEVVVVDNSDEATAYSTVSSFAASAPFTLRHVHEPRAGLSIARNTGARASFYDHIACLDDDEEVSVDWLTKMGEAFGQDPRVGIVSGFIAPADLTAEAQVRFEQFGGHSKGRHLEAALLHKRNCNALFPSPAFGAGGNMTFTRAAFDRIGGFDEALGAGTPARAAEDTLFLTEHLLSGGRISYQPAAVVWHHHRTDMGGLQGQFAGYGRGLTAFYAAVLLRHPGQLFALPGLVRHALKQRAHRRLELPHSLPDDFPSELFAGKRGEMLRGPLSYVRGRWLAASRGRRDR